MSGSYTAITQGIEVSVEPFYLDDESRPEESEYIWAYMVEIHNGGSEPVRLKTRYWQITDARGRQEEVSGEGVVGEQPVLTPGRSHDYVSGCPLQTPFGSMEGFYTFHREDGSPIEVRIPFFPLAAPATAH
mgnify:CR=1 FL=1